MGLDSCPLFAHPASARFRKTRLSKTTQENLLGYMKKGSAFGEADCDEITLAAFMEGMTYSFKLGGYLTPETLDAWGELLTQVLRDTPDVPCAEFHFGCEDNLIFYLSANRQAGDATPKLWYHEYPNARNSFRKATPATEDASASASASSSASASASASSRGSRDEARDEDRDEDSFFPKTVVETYRSTYRDVDHKSRTFQQIRTVATTVDSLWKSILFRHGM